MTLLDNLGAVELWDLDHPKLYTVTARLYQGGAPIDEYATRIGFREARFTPQGFMLNGKHIKLRGLNRHQTFPYVGGAMPARVQRRDAMILKQRSEVQHRAHLALSAIAAFSGRLRRSRPAGVRGDPRLAAHRRQGLAGSGGAQRGSR